MAESNALFMAYHAGLVRYLSGAVGHPETARDLTQDVFVRVAAAAALPASDEGKRAWVFHITRNIAIDYHRRQRHRRVEPITGEPPASRRCLGQAPAMDLVVCRCCACGIGRRVSGGSLDGGRD